MNWRSFLNSTYTNHLRYRGKILASGTLVNIHTLSTVGSLALITGRILRLNQHGMYEVEVPGLGNVHVMKENLSLI
jgi:serine/threonine protein kinase HipA of HipAB toxin-antitoxin module